MEEEGRSEASEEVNRRLADEGAEAREMLDIEYDEGLSLQVGL